MLVEYLANYVGEYVRRTDRVVEAFWPKAPCLRHWKTMLHLSLLSQGGSSTGGGDDAGENRLVSRRQESLIYVIHAAVMR